MKLRENIRRALRTECRADFLHLLRARRVCNENPRHVFGRLQNILANLKFGQHFNASSLARAMSTSTKTAHRDIAALKEMGVRFHYDFANHSFKLDHEQTLPWLVGYLNTEAT